MSTEPQLIPARPNDDAATFAANIHGAPPDVDIKGQLGAPHRPRALDAFLAGRILVGISDITNGTGIGRTSVYQEIWAGRLVARKVGKRTMFHCDDVRAWLDALPPFSSNAAA